MENKETHNYSFPDPGRASPEFKPKPLESDESFDEESGVGGSGSTCSLGLMKEEKVQKPDEKVDSGDIPPNTSQSKDQIGVAGATDDENHLSQHTLDSQQSLTEYPVSDASNGTPKRSKIPVMPGSTVKPPSLHDNIREDRRAAFEASATTDDILDKMASDISSQVLADAVSEVENEEALQSAIGKVSSDFVTGHLSVSLKQKSDEDVSPRSDISEPTTTSGISGDKNNMYHICEPWSDQDGAGTWSTCSSAGQTPRDTVKEDEKDPVRILAEGLPVAATPKMLPKEFLAPSELRPVGETPLSLYPDSICFSANHTKNGATPGRHGLLTTSTPFIADTHLDLQELRKKFEGFDESFQTGDTSTFTGAQVVPDYGSVGERRDMDTDEETIKDEEEVESVITNAGVKDYMPAAEREKLMTALGVPLPEPDRDDDDDPEPTAPSHSMYKDNLEHDVAEFRHQPRPQPVGTDGESDSTSYRFPPPSSDFTKDDPVRRAAMSICQPTGKTMHTVSPRVRILNDPDTIPQRESDISDGDLRRSPTDDTGISVDGDLHRGEYSDTSYQDLPDSLLGPNTSRNDDASAQSIIRDVNTSLGDTIITEIEDFLAQQSRRNEGSQQDLDENPVQDDISNDSITARIRELLHKCEQERSFNEDSSSTVVPSIVSDVSVSPSPKRDGPHGDAFDTEVTPDITSSGVTSDDVDRYGQILRLHLYRDDEHMTNRSEDSLSEKVHRLLQTTAHLSDDMSPRASPRSIHELIHSIHVHDESLDYEKLQRELDYIERSLEEKEASPRSRMSQASSCRSSGTSVSEEGDKSKRLAWDYGADIGEGDLPQFVASVKNPKDDLIQAINNLTAIEEDRQHRRARSVSPNPEERKYMHNLSRALTEPDLAFEQQPPSLSGLLADKDSLALKVLKLLEKESPQQQAYDILREAEETEYMIHLRAMQAARLDDDDIRRYDDRVEPMRESYGSYRSLPGSKSPSSSRLHQHDLYSPNSISSLARSDSRLSADQYHREIRERYSDQMRETSPERCPESRGRTPTHMHRPRSSTSLHRPSSVNDERLSPSLSRHASTPTLTTPTKRDHRSDYESSLGLSMSPMAKKPFHAFSHAADFLSIQLDKMQHQRFDTSPKRQSRESLREPRHSPAASPKKSPTRQPKMGTSVNRGYLRRDLIADDSHDASQEVAQFTAEVRQRDIRRRLTPKDGRYLLYGATADDSKAPKFSSSDDQSNLDELRELARGRVFSTTKDVESSDLDSTPRDLASAAHRREIGRSKLSARDGADSLPEEMGTLSVGETTMESTHTGSDDAEGPYLPRHLLGSRPDVPIRGGGIYANKNRAKSLEKVDEASRGSLVEIRAPTPSEYSEESPQFRRPAWEEDKKMETSGRPTPTEMVDLRLRSPLAKSRSSELPYEKSEAVVANKERERASYGVMDRDSSFEGRTAASSGGRQASSLQRSSEEDVTLEDLTGPTDNNDFKPLEPTMSANSSDRDDPPLRTAGLKPRPALRILQDILEGESDGSESLPSNLQEMWDRYRDAKRGDVGTSLAQKRRERFGLLADLLRNPTHHLVRRMEENNDLCKYERKLREKFGDDYEKVLSQRRQAWQQKEGRRSREGLSVSPDSREGLSVSPDSKRTVSPSGRSASPGKSPISDEAQVHVVIVESESPRSEQDSQGQTRSDLEADLSRTLRKNREGPIDDSTPRSSSTDTEMRAKMATILDQTDSLSSIPEGGVLRHSFTDATTTSFEIDKIPLGKLDPKYVKLQLKIREQKEKYAKEKRRELKRKEKIVKLERILHDKKTGKEVSITDSSSVTTVSSLLTSDTVSDVVVSDTSIEDTTIRAPKPVTSSTQFGRSKSLQDWRRKIRDANLSSASDSSFCPCKENISPTSSHETAHRGQERSRPSRSYKEAVYLEFDKPEKREPYRARPSRSRSLENRKRAEPAKRKQEIPKKNKKVQIQIGSPKPKRAAKTREVGQNQPRLKMAASRKDRLVSMATQTSPRLFEGYVGIEGGDEKKGEAPESETKVPPSRMFSPEKIFVERKKHKPAPKGSPGGMAWYVPVKETQPPWRLPLKERQAHLLRQETEPWQGTYPAPAEEKDPMEGVEVAPDTEFCLGKKEAKEDGKKRMTLQEALLLFRQDFVSHSRERVRRLNLAARERMMQHAHDEQREKLFKHNKMKQANLNAHPLSDLWFRPQKRVMSKKEMRNLTERIYQKLPEVTEKVELKKREAEYKTNRLRAEIYKRKQLEKVLGRY